MRTGDLITVEGKAGRVTARVLDLRAAADMPDLPIDVSDEARKILADEYRRVAILAYRYGVERIPVMFVALEDESGAWCDLQGHALSITAATTADIEPETQEDPCPAPSTGDTPAH